MRGELILLFHSVLSNCINFYSNFCLTFERICCPKPAASSNRSVLVSRWRLYMRGKSGEGRKTVINKWSIIKTKHVKMFLISFHQWDFTEWIIRINVTAKMKTIFIYGWLIIWLYIVFRLAQKYLTHGDVIIVVEGLLKVGLYWLLFASY